MLQSNLEKKSPQSNKEGKRWKRNKIKTVSSSWGALPAKTIPVYNPMARDCSNYLLVWAQISAKVEINLPKETKDLFSKKYKALMKEIKEDTNRW